jgi:magnesium-transporting ATPase (P-type)
MVAVLDCGKSRVTRYIWISCHAQILQVVGWLNDWQKERQFKVLNEKEERGVKVILNVVEHLIDVKECWFLSFFLSYIIRALSHYLRCASRYISQEVVVGDVALLEPGEIVPCDGVLLSGHNVKCDESAATGVTGDGTNDGPAHKTAHVGFSMGIAGTEVAKEASDIILMDDNFSSIVKAIMWGRCVNDALRKFMQFQLSINITAVVVTFVTTVASNSESSALSTVQFLWINLIVDTFAAFAIILLFHFLGVQILGFEPTSANDTIVRTVVFNTFVFAQIFNLVNSRRLDRKLNIFKDILNNWYFMVITIIGELSLSPLELSS